MQAATSTPYPKQSSFDGKHRIVDLSLNDDTLVAEEPHGQNTAALITPIIPSRCNIFEKLPQIIPDIDDVNKMTIFTRRDLQNAIGGTIQSLIIRCVTF